MKVVNCFAVPHSEKQEEVAVGQTFNRTMYNLHSAVNKKEQIVGWYATSMDGSLIVDSSSLIHDFYAQVRRRESMRRGCGHVDMAVAAGVGGRGQQ